jgi:hypothetical protein
LKSMLLRLGSVQLGRSECCRWRWRRVLVNVLTPVSVSKRRMIAVNVVLLRGRMLFDDRWPLDTVFQIG